MRSDEKTVLEPAKLVDALMELPGWEVKGKQICKTFDFPTWEAGVEFAQGLAAKAGAASHYPDITISLKKVKVVTWTQKVGGVSMADIRLAKEAEVLFESA